MQGHIYKLTLQYLCHLPAHPTFRTIPHSELYHHFDSIYPATSGFHGNFTFQSTIDQQKIVQHVEPSERLEHRTTLLHLRWGAARGTPYPRRSCTERAPSRAPLHARRPSPHMAYRCRSVYCRAPGTCPRPGAALPGWPQAAGWPLHASGYFLSLPAETHYAARVRARHRALHAARPVD